MTHTYFFRRWGTLTIQAVSIMVLLFVMLFSTVTSSSAQEQTGGGDETQPTISEQATVIATVNIFDITVTPKENNTFQVSFTLHNREGVQSGIRYAIALQKDGGYVDRQVADEVLTLGPGESVQRTVTYTAPSYLPAGEYTLWVEAQTLSSLPLGSMMAANPITLTGTSSVSLELAPEDCVLYSKNDPERTFLPEEGIDVAVDEALVLECHVSPSETVQVTPVITQYYRSVFGKQVRQDTFPAQTLSAKNPTLTLTVPVAKEPQAYFALLQLQDEQGKDLTTPLSFRYVLQGPSATVQNVVLDKRSYQKGDTAFLAVTWSLAADTFSGARGKGTPVEGQVKLTLTDGKGTVCADPYYAPFTAEQNAYHSTFSLAITHDCSNPVVAIDVVDKEGKVLSAATYEVTKNASQGTVPLKQQVSSRDASASLFLALALAVLGGVLVLILLFALSRKRTSSLSSFLFLGILSGAFLFFTAPRASADTLFQNSGSHDGHDAIVITVNINKQQFNASEPIIAVTAIFHNVCTNRGYQAIRVGWDPRATDPNATKGSFHPLTDQIAYLSDKAYRERILTRLLQELQQRGLTGYIRDKAGNDLTNVDNDGNGTPDWQEKGGLQSSPRTFVGVKNCPDDLAAPQQSSAHFAKWTSCQWEAYRASRKIWREQMRFCLPNDPHVKLFRLISIPVLDCAAAGADVRTVPSTDGNYAALFRARFNNVVVWNNNGNRRDRVTGDFFHGIPYTVGNAGPPPPGAPSITLSANPPALNDLLPGESGTTQLTWSVTGNATSCTASGGWSGSKSTTGGSENVTLSSTTVYTLTCTGPGGSSNKSVTVTVNNCTSQGSSCQYSDACTAGACGQVTQTGDCVETFQCSSGTRSRVVDPSQCGVTQCQRTVNCPACQKTSSVSPGEYKETSP